MINFDDIKQAIIERENKKQEIQDKANSEEDKSSKKGTGIANRRAALRNKTDKTDRVSRTTKPTTTINDDDDDEMPF